MSDLSVVEEKGKEEYMKAYDDMLSLWPVPYESIDVQTEFGSTHINLCGPENADPIILLHAASVSSTEWFTNISELSRDHRTYAVDIIGDCGKSVVTRPLENRGDYAEWLKEVFDKLGIKKASIVGHSYGGWLALNMAISYPERLNKLILLAPAASIYPFKLFVKLGLKIAELKIRPSARSTLKMQAGKDYVLNETFVNLMDKVSKYCVPKMIFPTVYTDEELKQVKTPTLLLIGEEEKIYDPASAINHAKSLIEDIEAEIVPKAGHTLNMEQPEIVNSKILEFLKEKIG